MSDLMKQGSAGAANLAKWNASGRKYREIEQAVAEFEVGLEGRLGPEPTADRRALAATAATLFTGVLLVRRKLGSARGQLPMLLEQLPILSGALGRTLRLLGVTDGDAPAPGEPRSTAEWMDRLMSVSPAPTPASSPNSAAPARSDAR